MIELKNESLIFSFPDVHPDAEISINFQRTLRIPDDKNTYPLPPGLGTFPLKHIDDYKVPSNWVKHGGLQIVVYSMKRAIFEQRFPKIKRKEESRIMYQIAAPAPCEFLSESASFDMGLAPGGKMHQEIYEDPYDFDDWNQNTNSRCFVHIW